MSNIMMILKSGRVGYNVIGMYRWILPIALTNAIFSLIVTGITTIHVALYNNNPCSIV